MLERLAWNLPDVWKKHFGLYTQYIGYLKPEQIKTLMVLKMETLQEDVSCKDLSIEELNSLARNKGLQEIPNSNEWLSVLPELWKYIEEYDLDTISETEWDSFIDYLDAKSSDEKER